MVGQLTVIAEFETTSDTYDKFLEICTYDSERSVADEAGCHAFNVLTPQDEANTIVLVEIYEDRAAFETHLKTPHFGKFAESLRNHGTNDMIVLLLTQRAP